jgi:hygromycin-B 7''-O-kinase
MPTLPSTVDAERYYDTIYREPLAFWQPALDEIARRHELPAGPWERASLGRNIVFLSDTVVVKLGPPCWPDEMPYEVTVLQDIAGRLPVQTPALLAHGNLDYWDYLVQARLPGTNLHSLWNTLPPVERIDLAQQHGILMAALHALPVESFSPSLLFDWQTMLTLQRASCIDSMAQSGISGPLLAHAEEYLATVEAELFAESPFVALHGDLTHLNLLVEHNGERWQITSLIDWGDIKIGPRSHELISPCMHMYRGDKEALAAWYAAYGLPTGEERQQLFRRATARIMLYYAGELAGMLRLVPGASECQTWVEVEQCLWGEAA